MDVGSKVLIAVLLLLSVAMLAIPLTAFVVSIASGKKLLKSDQKSGISGMLAFSACLIGCVWFLRYAVGYYKIIVPGEGVTLNCLEEFFNSLVHALQTFSMDEDYTDYILSGKDMIRSLFGRETIWESVYGFYAAVLNVVAPVAGGAVILDILAGVFPNVRLWFSYLNRRRDKYFFSELNEASLALASSIDKVEETNRPLIIFTDVYIDDEKERDSELLLEAKALGAVCIRDDLIHVRKNKHGNRKFFLIDQRESGNLRTLAEMTNKGNYPFLKNAEIFLFTNDDAYIQAELRIRDRLENEFNFKESEMPVVIPVQSYRNLVSDLLGNTVPLYEPLIGREKEDAKTLTVTILGTGQIGREMFLTTYWIGQILDCELRVNVLSQETEEEFWNRIDYINPEIKKSTMADDPILWINKQKEKSPVYCKVFYTQCDMKSAEFVETLTDARRGVLDSDYFFVALGSDEVNISVANTVRRFVGQHHLEPDKNRRTVITYVVYDQALTTTLNRKMFFCSDNRQPDIYMRAIGSLEEVYSYENVFLAHYGPDANRLHAAYTAQQKNDARAEKNKNRLKDDYKYWATLARVLHRGYKVYSMGLFSKSLFDYSQNPSAYGENVQRRIQEAREKVSYQVNYENPEQQQAHLKMLHRLAWLEHRRWNAFTRVKGFRSTDAYEKYILPEDGDSYKQMELKLHPCLVECDEKGIRGDISWKGQIDNSSLLQWDKYPDLDMLDLVSKNLCGTGERRTDFKVYDYPTYSLKPVD